MRDVARASEDLGFHSLWVSDHVVMPLEQRSRYPYAADGRMPWDPSVPYFDPFASLTWAAAVTERPQLGIGVLVMPLRSPLLVAKQAATVDSLSGGRLVLGLGSGWLREEFTLIGQRWEDRGARLTEAIGVLRHCWEPDPVRLDDAPDGLDNLAMAPKPEHGSRLPIVLGGGSGAALRRLAALGDGWYAPRLSPADFALTAQRIADLLEQHGRPRESVVLGARPWVAMNSRAASVADEYRRAGAGFIVFDLDYLKGTLEDAMAAIRQIALDLDLRSQPMQPIAALSSTTWAVGPR
jgi:probable F420-dependent oxidoreductase